MKRATGTMATFTVAPGREARALGCPGQRRPRGADAGRQVVGVDSHGWGDYHWHSGHLLGREWGWPVGTPNQPQPSLPQSMRG